MKCQNKVVHLQYKKTTFFKPSSLNTENYLKIKRFINLKLYNYGCLFF